jgi:hypothetical protein
LVEQDHHHERHSLFVEVRKANGEHKTSFMLNWNAALVATRQKLEVDFEKNHGTVG